MLRIYDEFLEDETIVDLHDRAYRLHVSALIYCSRNLTDGELTDRAMKMLQVLLGYPLRRYVAELVTAGLWVEHRGVGYRIKNYLDFNPSAKTVKAEKKKARDRMRKLREKRATDDPQEPVDERSPEHDPERSLQSHTGPSQAFELDQEPGRQSEPEEGLPFENELLRARLMQAIGDHADTGTRGVVRSYVRKLPPAAIAKVAESLTENTPADRAAYAVAALKSECDERSAA